MRTTILLLAAAFVAVSVPLAAADETAPDCESDQPWIGYRSTLTARDVYYANAPEQGQSLNVCEGEHWDGQDTVQDDAPTCTPAVSADPADLFVGMCTGPDINGPVGDDPTNPLGLRVSSTGDNAYVGTNIALVGRAAVYVDSSTAAVYVRDNTIGNVLATGVSAPGITRGYVSENDCDQDTYQTGAMNDDRTLCGRDNTAITVEHGLLP